MGSMVSMSMPRIAPCESSFPFCSGALYYEVYNADGCNQEHRMHAHPLLHYVVLPIQDNGLCFAKHYM
eukprot:1146357-Pelagomonas_calceolata.AAC.3